MAYSVRNGDELVDENGRLVGVRNPDSSEQLYVFGATDPVTGGIEYSAGEGRSIRPGIGQYQQLKKNPKAFAVMASPPTVSVSAVNPLSSGQRFAATNQDGAADLSYVSIFRAAYPYQRDANYPLYDFIGHKTVSYDSTPTYKNLTTQISFIHTGVKCAVYVSGSGTQILIKVDDEFVSLTPTSVASDGGLYFVIIDFGATEAQRRIDVIGGGSPLNFGGIYAGNGDIVQPATRRGPRSVFVGDSFGEGTGNDVSSLYSWIDYCTEYLGWDDVIKSAVGGTGVVHAGSRYNFQQRALRDIAGANPELVWISLSVNDSTYSGDLVLSGLKNIVSTVHAAGVRPIWVFSSPTQARGTGLQSYNVRQANKLCREWARSQGYIYIDDMEQPVNEYGSLQSTTLTSPVTANATSVVTAKRLITGACYKFPDETAFFVRNAPNLTATIDNAVGAWPAGTVITQCGPSLLTGTGYVEHTTGWGSSDTCISSDSTHPTDKGHKLKGHVDACLFLREIYK